MIDTIIYIATLFILMICFMIIADNKYVAHITHLYGKIPIGTISYAWVKNLVILDYLMILYKWRFCKNKSFKYVNSRMVRLVELA